MTRVSARNPFLSVATVVALALVSADCTPTAPTEVGSEAGGPPAQQVPAWTASCEVVSCELPGIAGACLVDRNLAGGFLVPVAATLVFRSQIGGNPLPTPPFRFSWSFGDGATALPPSTNEPESRVQHVYGNAQTHDVGVSVTDGGGLTRTAQCQVTTSEAPPLRVQCDANPVRGPAPLTVAFEVQRFNCVGECPFTWDFGDGSPPNLGGRVEHTYAAPGTYTARGTLRDSLGNNDTCSKTIVVTPPSAPPAPTPTGNHTPVIVWSVTPGGAAVGRPFAIGASITDSDGHYSNRVRGERARVGWERGGLGNRRARGQR